MSETHAINNLEKTHLTYKPGQTYIALEDKEFRWTIEQVMELETMWNDGVSVEYMADHFGRTCLETGLLIADRAELGRLKPRKHGLLGGLVV